MLKIGLTGGIGSGKSTAVDAFRVLGSPIIDADRISKDLVKAGQDTLKEIADAFGSDILLENGELDRKTLGRIVFSEPEALSKLESILHPRIRLEIKSQISDFQNLSSPPPYIIVDIPLLVENDYQELFDKIITVDCTPEQQIERVMARDDIDLITLEGIMKKQASRNERLEAATHILDNSGTIESLLKQIDELHNEFSTV